jgi:endonuclease/exonuclease/phosphatase (EEP) superfamily protein YafD
LRIPIDHVLHTPGISIQTRRLGMSTGSDHLPVIVEFSPTSANTG